MIRFVTSLNVYKKVTINKALEDYKDFADIKVSYENQQIIFEFSKCIYDENRTRNEFENYLIGLENT